MEMINGPVYKLVGNQLTLQVPEIPQYLQSLKLDLDQEVTLKKYAPDEFSVTFYDVAVLKKTLMIDEDLSKVQVETTGYKLKRIRLDISTTLISQGDIKVFSHPDATYIFSKIPLSIEKSLSKSQPLSALIQSDQTTLTTLSSFFSQNLSTPSSPTSYLLKSSKFHNLSTHIHQTPIPEFPCPSSLTLLCKNMSSCPVPSPALLLCQSHSPLTLIIKDDDLFSFPKQFLESLKNKYSCSQENIGMKEEYNFRWGCKLV